MLVFKNGLGKVTPAEDGEVPNSWVGQEVPSK
jgi:hypothetical protein